MIYGQVFIYRLERVYFFLVRDKSSENQLVDRESKKKRRGIHSEKSKNKEIGIIQFVTVCWRTSSVCFNFT